MKRHPFNLIELLLALGVIVIGLVSVMALFPIGASTNRDAMAENYSAQAAEQMLNSLAFYMRKSSANWDAAANGGTNPIPQQKATIADQKTMLEDQADFFADNDSAHECKFLGGSTETVYWRDPNNFTKGFRVENKGGTGDLPDFQAMVALWHEPIELGSTSTPHPEISTTLHLEISWPAQLPYERRRKARYSLQVFNPNH